MAVKSPQEMNPLSGVPEEISNPRDGIGGGGVSVGFPCDTPRDSLEHCLGLTCGALEPRLGRDRLAPDTARVALEHLGHRRVILGHRCVLNRVALEPQLGRCLASGPASASSTTGDGPPHARPCGDSRRAEPDMDACSPPPHANIITGKWVFKHKFHPDGTLDRHKARWVVRGFRQRVDFTDTFAPVVKPGTIRTVLQLAVSRAWPVHQMDVSNAFLHGHLEEQVFCQQPTGFVDSAHPDHVCLLSRSLYGLKQAPRAWYQRIVAFLHQLGFRSTRSDASLFVYNNGATTAYLLLYVDDIILTASSTDLLRQTPRVFARGPWAPDDASSYRSIVGALQYLTLTRPELQYAVQQVCLRMHAPRDPHWAAVKRILRYIRGTMDFGLSLHASTATNIVAYSDADWAGCPDTRRSTSGYCVYFGPSLISWSSKRQPTVSRSSAEAEYRAVANAVAEVSWLRQLLVELSCPVAKATVVYCDNVSAVYLSANPVHHRRTKHIELDIHFVREQVALGHIRVLHVPTSQQFADIMTKDMYPL
ncbi:hypothetical protein QYE76_044074 [Lolium multiflorum]|uniref:Reverse transcriptase Ty1/copia-type domain-containing protein n=1 Tax=Lolium multiflorum TaxID=4521 RepID=A0AAD8TIK1_LOLMU|nr:hypothetical protein QYE76_044074 [Lolium multiflorum]